MNAPAPPPGSAPTPDRAGAAAGDGSSGRGLRLVLADDDAGILGALEDLLEGEGHQVVATARDGAAALASIEREHPDLAVLDLRMPGMSGIEVAATLMARGEPVPVVLLSAFDDPHLQLEAARLGVAEYLVKGCPSTDIFKALDACVRRIDGPGDDRLVL